MTKLSDDEAEGIREFLALQQKLEAYETTNKIEFFQPAPKQKAFLDMGTVKKERLFRAGNQIGKSMTGAYETACHLTGLYPDDWKGKKFNYPTRGWAAGVSSLATRDVIQTLLCGPFECWQSELGTGMIPKDMFADKPSLARGVTDAFDTISVYHYTGGIRDGVSSLSLKSYEQGRAKFQGATLDFGWADEEPQDMAIYTEFLTRIKSSGVMYTTFTPLYGETDLVKRFNESTPLRGMVEMSLDEATWLTEEEKEERLARYPVHERDTRRYGIPMMGEGRIFVYDEETIKEDYLDYVPPSWAKIWGVDFGIGHPFAAVLLLWDRDNDIIHIHQTVKLVDDGKHPEYSRPLFHAMAMKAIAAAVPVAWPHDGHIKEKGGGDTVASLYKQQDLLMLPNHATWPEGGFGTEPGIQEICDRITTGRFKVSKHLSDWFAEYRAYHREKGLIVKKNDDLLSATRIALMMKRFAKPVGLGGYAAKKNRLNIQGQDFDLFSV